MNIKLIIKPLMLFLALFFTFGCAGKEEPKKRSEELKFKVDWTLLQSKHTITGLNVSFNPPKNWLIIPDSTMNSIREEIEAGLESKGFAKVDLRTLFLDKKNSCLAGVFVVNLQGENKLEEYRSLFKAIRDSSSFRVAEYIKDNIRILNYIIHEQNMVNFKIVFESRNGALIQIDYFAPEHSFGQQAKAIESSIGTLKIY